MAKENQTKFSKKLPIKKTLWILCSVIFGVSLICLCTILTSRSKFEPNLNNPESIAKAFAYSLAYNKLENMKLYVSPQKWPFIDSWPNLHQPVSPDCKNPNDIDLGPSSMSSYDAKNHSLFISFHFNQDCPNYYYTFSVHGVVVEIIDNKWKITAWDEICEVTIDEVCY